MFAVYVNCDLPLTSGIRAALVITWRASVQLLSNLTYADCNGQAKGMECFTTGPFFGKTTSKFGTNSLF